MINHDCLSESEIWEKYKRADDPDAMVTVLADLTGCTRKEMQKHLGHTQVRTHPPMAYNVAKDNRMELYRQGMTDKEMAESLGITTTAVRSWRKRKKLSQN